MNDYKETFSAWAKKATDKFEEIDAQIGLKDKIESGAKVVVDTAKTGADYVKNEAEKSDLGRRAVKVVEDAASTAGDAAKTAWNASEPVRDTAVDLGGKTGGVVADTAERAADFARDVAGGVGTNAKRVVKVVGLGTSITTTMDAGLRSAKKAATWAADDPIRAATTGVSMAIGAGLGIVLTGISSHWLLNSAIPTWSVKKLAEQFDGYLSRREALIEGGQLTEADAERIAFERDIAKRVGAPLLGAFSFASGAVMLSSIFNPAAVTGFPLGSIIGGNPLLQGVWFFGNGMVCFKTSYEFFMIAKYAAFLGDAVQTLFTAEGHLAYGLQFSGSLLFILICHEMGHYVACRKYRVDATLPFFLPTPPMLGPAGTFGAFIKILSPMPSRKAVFDIGVAGPIAGFVALIPIAIIGVSSMKVIPPEQLGSLEGTITFTDPLFMRLIAMFSGIDLQFAAGNAFYFAAWVGLLVTALNLIPSGQLDGGHAIYAIFGENVHRWTGRIAFPVMATLAVVGLVFFGSPSGFLVAIILGVMMRIRHPTPWDVRPLDAKRKVVAFLTLVIFVLCFTPFPIRIN